jgi:hypothetical protein
MEERRGQRLIGPEGKKKKKAAEGCTGFHRPSSSLPILLLALPHCITTNFFTQFFPFVMSMNESDERR